MSVLIVLLSVQISDGSRGSRRWCSVVRIVSGEGFSERIGSEAGVEWHIANGWYGRKYLSRANEYRRALRSGR